MLKCLPHLQLKLGLLSLSEEIDKKKDCKKGETMRGRGGKKRTIKEEKCVKRRQKKE